MGHHKYNNTVFIQGVLINMLKYDHIKEKKRQMR